MKYIIIFPDKEQKEIIKTQYSKIKEEIIIIERENDGMKKQFFSYNERIKILCCHEEAIYWLMNHWQKNVEISFDKKCFCMTQKWDAYKIFKENNIPTVYKTKNENEIQNFPIVAKPNIGFGSIGVVKIKNNEDLREYIRKFELEMNQTIIDKYTKKFFKNKKNFPIFEECVENGQFFSVSFIVDNNCNIQIYPVIGIRKEITSNSSYRWKTFLYKKQYIKKEIYEEMKNIIEKICKNWIKTPSINLVEMIYDNDKKKLKVLEFSPRIVGGQIAKMLEYATGINLKKTAIDLFFDKCSELKEKEEKNIIVDICETDENNNIINQYNGELAKKYKLIEEIKRKSTIGENTLIYRIYESDI